MALNNSQCSPINSYCVDDEVLTIGFFPAGAGAPTGVTGPYVPTVTRTGAGIYQIVLNGYVPKALLCAYAIGTDQAAAANTRVDVDALVTISSAARTTTISAVVTRNGTTGAVKDIAANAASFVRVNLHFKVFPGKDLTGL